MVMFLAYAAWKAGLILVVLLLVSHGLVQVAIVTWWDALGPAGLRCPPSLIGLAVGVKWGCQTYWLGLIPGVMDEEPGAARENEPCSLYMPVLLLSHWPKQVTWSSPETVWEYCPL
jgi:hypothetical protein